MQLPRSRARAVRSAARWLASVYLLARRHCLRVAARRAHATGRRLGRRCAKSHVIGPSRPQCIANNSRMCYISPSVIACLFQRTGSGCLWIAGEEATGV